MKWDLLDSVVSSVLLCEVNHLICSSYLVFIYHFFWLALNNKVISSNSSCSNAVFILNHKSNKCYLCFLELFRNNLCIPNFVCWELLRLWNIRCFSNIAIKISYSLWLIEYNSLINSFPGIDFNHKKSLFTVSVLTQYKNLPWCRCFAIVVCVNKGHESPRAKMHKTLRYFICKMNDSYWAVIRLACFVAKYRIVDNITLLIWFLGEVQLLITRTVACGWEKASC